MWIPRRYWEISIRRQEELERRVKRLELILLKEAENKIASLSDREAGKNIRTDICLLKTLSIEELRLKENMLIRLCICNR